MMSRYNKGNKNGFKSSFFASLLSFMCVLGIASAGIAVYNHYEDKDNATQEVEQEKTEEKEDLEIFHSIMEDVVGEFFIEPEEDSFEEDAFCFFEF